MFCKTCKTLVKQFTKIGIHNFGIHGAKYFFFSYKTYCIYPSRVILASKYLKVSPTGFTRKLLFFLSQFNAREKEAEIGSDIDLNPIDPQNNVT